MPAARYWRAVGIEAHAGGDLELSALHVYDAGGRVDAGATLTSTIAPAVGTLAYLQDSDFGTTARFAAAAIAAPSFALRWDFGAPVDVYGVRASGPAAAEFLKSLTLQYSSDGAAWGDGAELGDFIYPGAASLTAAPTSPPWFYSGVNRWEVRTSASFSFLVASADGVNLMGGAANTRPQRSLDAGATWAEITALPSGVWAGAAMSANGQKVAAAVNNWNFYTSEDGGTTWTQRTTSGARAWRGISSSADRSVIAAGVSGGNIYISTDGGATWAQRAPSASWEDVFVSADGTKMAAASYNAGIYTSADSGLTWVQSSGTAGKNWNTIGGSADGMTLLAGAAQSGLNISKDGGTTWALIPGLPSVGFGWAASEVSPDGMHLVAAVSDGAIYRSRNAGLDWVVEKGAGATGWSARTGTLSADGQKFAIAANSGVRTVAFRDPMFADPPLRTTGAGAPEFFATSPIPDFTTIKLPDVMPWRDMEFAGNGKVTGTVKEKNTPANTPLRRRVRLVREIDGLQIRETWSDASTGAYEFLQIDERHKYSVISYDYAANYRAVIADSLTPEIMT